MPVEYAPPNGPASIYIQYDKPADVAELARRIGATFEPWSARRLSALLPSLSTLVETARVAAKPPRGYSIEWLDGRRLDWVDTDEPSQPGLYRYRGYGLPQYRLYDGLQWREIDRDLGVWAALGTTREDLLKFEPEEVNGTLSVRQIGRLPLLHARAAVLCSGLPPSSVVPGWIQYVNVPSSIAGRIARSLGQPFAAASPSATHD
jgi:hypothetical protein